MIINSFADVILLLNSHAVLFTFTADPLFYASTLLSSSTISIKLQEHIHKQLQSTNFYLHFDIVCNCPKHKTRFKNFARSALFLFSLVSMFHLHWWAMWPAPVLFWKRTAQQCSKWRDFILHRQNLISNIDPKAKTYSTSLMYWSIIINLYKRDALRLHQRFS